MLASRQGEHPPARQLPARSARRDRSWCICSQSAHRETTPSPVSQRQLERAEPLSIHERAPSKKPGLCLRAEEEQTIPAGGVPMIRNADGSLRTDVPYATPIAPVASFISAHQESRTKEASGLALRDRMHSLPDVGERTLLCALTCFLSPLTLRAGWMRSVNAGVPRLWHRTLSSCPVLCGEERGMRPFRAC